MPIFRSMIRGLGRTLAMPATAPARQVARSARTIAADIEQLRHQRAARAAELEAQARELRLDEIDDAAQRFEIVRAARGLTDHDIALKLRGMRRNRRAFVGIAAFFAIAGALYLARVAATGAGPQAFVVGVMLLTIAPIAALQAFWLGLGQHQLESRRLDGAWVYFSRRDLFRHWLGW